MLLKETESVGSNEEREGRELFWSDLGLSPSAKKVKIEGSSQEACVHALPHTNTPAPSRQHYLASIPTTGIRIDITY